MRLLKLALLLGAFTFFIAACNNTTNQTSNTTTQPTPAASPTVTASSTPADEFAAVRPVYARECALCHQDNGEGGKIKTDEGTLNVPTFKAGHALKHTDEQFAKQISNGGDGMPPFKDKLKQDEINGLVRMIRKEFQSGAGQTTPSPQSAASPSPKK